MKRPLCLTLLILLNVCLVKAQCVIVGHDTLSIDTFNDPHIPVLIINTIDGEEPTYEVSNAPEGLWGTSIKNNLHVNGRMVMTLSGDTIYDSGSYVSKESGMRIKIRGNTSTVAEKKKRYKIKLQKSADLLLRADSTFRKDKDWVLIHSGAMSTNALIGFWTSELVGMQWTPSFRYVNVVMNNIYRGVYLLTESVERESCKLNVDKLSGCVIECDAYWWNEDVYVESSNSKYVNYTFKYPEADEITFVEKDYIQAAINEMEASLTEEDYPSYIDLPSFASWLIAHDLLGSFDSGGSNIFLTKYDNTADSKFMMANLWDFDCIKRPDVWARIHEDPNAFYYCKLFENSNKAFTKEYIRQWKDISDALVDTLIERCNQFADSPLATAVDHFYNYDIIVSGWEVEPIQQEIESHKKWFTERKAWLDAAIFNLESSISSISSPTLQHEQPAFDYDITGRRVGRGYRGIVINNRKKIIR